MSSDRPSDRDRIQAPWRIDYILRGNKDTTCPFCEAPGLGRGERSLVLAAQKHSFVMLNRYPYTGCHLMVIPRAHEPQLGNLAPEVYAEMMELVKDSVARLRLACRPNGINLGMNLGTAAGAGIAEHLHMHIVPRWDGDTNFMAVVGGVRVVSQDVEHAWATLAPMFEELHHADP